jgi:hypothetical protein
MLYKAALSLLALAIPMLFSACSKDPEASRVSGDVRVRLPWADDQGEMKLDVVSLSGLEDLTQVRGHYASFVFAPKIMEDRLSGDSPRARFLRTNDGIYVPTDEISQQMAVIYAHLERLSGLDTKAGIGNLLSWPRKVGVSVRIRDADGIMTDNSFYDGGSDSILMVPTKNGALPLAANPGVLAHEHFHALFYRLVQMPLVAEGKLQKSISGSSHSDVELMAHFMERAAETKPGSDEAVLPQKDDGKSEMQLYHTILMKAVNEGLADVWGWIYSGNPDFLGTSLPAEKQCRSLRADTDCLHDKAFIDRATMKSNIETLRVDSVNPSVTLNNYTYLPGTQLSRALRNTFLTAKNERSAQGMEERLKLAARIIKALPRVALQIRSDTAGNETDIEGVYKIISDIEPMSATEKANSESWLQKKREAR